jgi:hypothetical protein
MIDVEDAAEPLFEELRRVLAPSHADQARVLAALEGRLAGGSEPPLQRDERDAAGSSGAPSSQKGSRWTQRLAILKPLGLSVLAAFLFGVGASSFLQTSRSAQPPARVQPLAARVVPVPPPAPPMPPTPTAPAVVSPSVPIAAPALSAPRHRHVANPSTPRVERGAQESPASLRIELDALQRAELALRDRQPARALDILNECERNVVPGRMREERQAAAFVARCALFPDQHAAMLSEFTHDYPRSAYAARVQRSCSVP